VLRVQYAAEAILKKSPPGIRLEQALKRLPKKDHFRRFLELAVKFRKLYYKDIRPKIALGKKIPKKQMLRFKKTFYKMSRMALDECRGKTNMFKQKYKPRTWKTTQYQKIAL
jgi:hypothetical protein